MTHAAVDEILDLIDSLPDSDRQLLEQRLAERLEADWRREAEQARQQARACGIDQAAIDEAVRKQRYGS